MSRLFHFADAVRRDPGIETWMREHADDLGAIARLWFEVMRDCGDDVREVLHDGHPTACIGDAAFAYVNAFKAHVNVGFFRGVELADPQGLLEGTGRFMRHVKLRPEGDIDAGALRKLIEAAYSDMKRLRAAVCSQTGLPPERRTDMKPKKKDTSRATEPRKAATKPKSPPKEGATGEPASRLIDQRIRDLEGWRGETLARMRALILEADPEMTEEWKWATPVWSHHGIVCTGEAYKKVVKLTFARGAGTPDPSGLFNSSLGGNTRRAIDIREGETVDPRAFKALVKAAVAQNGPPAMHPPPASP